MSRRHEQKHLLHNRSYCRYYDCSQSPRVVLGITFARELCRANDLRCGRALRWRKAFRCASERKVDFFEDKPHVTRLPSLDSLRDAVDAAIEASETASRLLLEATVEGKESKIAMLLAVHRKAIEMRLKAETHYREELERRVISYSA
jgi:hypothetical protein